MSFLLFIAITYYNNNKTSIIFLRYNTLNIIITNKWRMKYRFTNKRKQMINNQLLDEFKKSTPFFLYIICLHLKLAILIIVYYMCLFHRKIHFFFTLVGNYPVLNCIFINIELGTYWLLTYCIENHENIIKNATKNYMRSIMQLNKCLLFNRWIIMWL